MSRSPPATIRAYLEIVLDLNSIKRIVGYNSSYSFRLRPQIASVAAERIVFRLGDDTVFDRVKMKVLP